MLLEIPDNFNSPVNKSHITSTSVVEIADATSPKGKYILKNCH